MKKLALIAVLVLLVSAPLFAANSTTTQIKAVISADLSITAGLPAGPTTLPLAGGTTTLGTITVNSNIAGAWNITVSSLNKGVMKAPGVSVFYPYTFDVKTGGGTSVPGLSGDLGDGTTAADKSANVTTGVATVVYTLEVTNAAASSFSPALPAGEYVDSITLTVSTL
ncbi:MAG TPA: hypothetical protein DCQ16_00395 [Spirochaetaceae bacterium]|nr:hypothetical protein [Spirochaetaceae bacterium]